MNNIFENVKFGQRYMARNGKMLILTSLYEDCAFLTYEAPLTDGFSNTYSKYRLDGINLSDGKNADEWDVVKEWGS